ELEISGFRQIQAGVSRNRFDNYPRDLIRVRSKSLAHNVGIVKRQDNRVLSETSWNTRAIRISKRQRSGACPDQQRIRVSMITAVKLDDFIAFGESASQPNSRHGCLGTRVAHPDLLNRRHKRANQTGYRDFERVWDTEAGAVFGCSLDCTHDLRV